VPGARGRTAQEPSDPDWPAGVETQRRQGPTNDLDLIAFPQAGLDAGSQRGAETARLFPQAAESACWKVPTGINGDGSGP